MWLKVIFVAIFSVEYALSFSTGAGTTACGTLMPSHGGILPQQTLPPVTITRSAENVQQGQTLTLTITSNDANFSFRGFIVQARTLANEPEVVGRFIITDGMRAVNCQTLPATSVATHTSNNDKTSVTLQWQAYTNSLGLINFHITIVQNFNTFWTGIQSPFIFISPGVTPVPTTEPPTMEPPTIMPPIPDFNSYDGCGVTKVCFGGPLIGCVERQDCDLFGAVIFENDKFTFELLSKPGESYIAMAISDNNDMAGSSAIECVITSEDKAFTSFTTATTSPRIADQSIINLVSMRIVDGSIYCLVERDNFTIVEGMEFDLTNSKHYLLLVSGTEFTATSIGSHGVPARSSEPVSLTFPAIIAAERPLSVLLMLHGSFMIVAWILTSTVGVIIARYFKKSFTKQKVCGKHDVWFFWHVLCMVLTWVLTLSAFIIIFIEIGAWRTSVHSVVGTVVTVLLFFQPIGATFRPKPTHRNRPIFNIIHFSLGNFIQILAFITLFYAVPLTNSTLPAWSTFLLIGFVVAYLTMHAVMTTIRTCGDIKREDQKGSKTDSKYPLLGKTLLGAFVITAFLFSVAFILAFTINP